MAGRAGSAWEATELVPVVLLVTAVAVVLPWAVELLRRSGKSVPRLVAELGVSPRSLRNWARQIDAGEGRAEGLTSDEREEPPHRTARCARWCTRWPVGSPRVVLEPLPGQDDQAAAHRPVCPAGLPRAHSGAIDAVSSTTRVVRASHSRSGEVLAEELGAAEAGVGEVSLCCVAMESAMEPPVR